MPGVESYPNKSALVSDVKKVFAEGQAKSGRTPQVIVIGALGRCGRGAVDMCLMAGIPSEKILNWDLEETKPGGPFKEVVESDIFINCIYLTTKIPPFVTMETLNSPDRKLTVVCDVSADVTNKLTPGENASFLGAGLIRSMLISPQFLFITSRQPSTSPQCRLRA